MNRRPPATAGDASWRASSLLRETMAGVRPAEITMGPRRERYLLDSERLLGPALMAPAVIYLILVVGYPLVLAFLRSFLARDEFAINFYNRKGLLAVGRGVANGWSCDFRPIYGKLDGGGATTPQEIRAACWAPQPAPSAPH